MSPDELESIRSVAEGIVQETAPQEDVAFAGIWSDAIANLSSQELEAVPEKGASQFLGGGAELPLLSAIVVPIALWVGEKILDKAADEVLDDLIARIKKLLGTERKYEGGSLSDKDIDRLAAALAQRLTRALKKR